MPFCAPLLTLGSAVLTPPLRFRLAGKARHQQRAHGDRHTHGNRASHVSAPSGFLVRFDPMPDRSYLHRRPFATACRRNAASIGTARQAGIDEGGRRKGGALARFTAG